MIPLQPNIQVRQIAFKMSVLNSNMKQMKRVHDNIWNQFIIQSFSRGRVLLSGVEGEVSSGEVKWKI